MKSASPRGIAAALLVLVVAAVCVRLGFWQLDRLEQRRERNALLAAAMEAPVLSLTGDSLRAVMADPESYLRRRVRLRGTFDPRGTALLRGRARQGAPGVHLVTPLRIGGGEKAVLIDRGWVPAPDATTVDPRRFHRAGTVEVEGYLDILSSGSTEDAQPFRAVTDDFAVPTYQRLNLTAYSQDYPVDLLPFYIERTSAGLASEGAPFGAPPPRLDEGPHLGYAIQWFSFAAIAVIGFAIVAARRGG